MITLPADFTSYIASSTSMLFVAFKEPITLVLGTLLAGVLITIIIGAIKGR